MIQVDGLSKFYGGRTAIQNVSFRIEKGEIVGLLGLNGAGKSTILKILGCFLMPSGGRASIAGFSVEDNPNDIRSLIGYLPDTPPLYNEMIVHKYLAYVAQLKGVPSSKVDEHVKTAIERTNLHDVEESAIGSLSHGFRQRVGIAQAIVHRPQVLILDEPINGLDPVQIVEMRDLIVSLRKEHTVILSSHILSEITKTCDRILIVDHGKLVAETKGGELQKSNTLRVSLEVGYCTPAVEAAVAAIPGVHITYTKAVDTRTTRLDLELSTDQRAKVARAVMESGAELLGLGKQGDELEALFMKFVRS